MHIYFDRTFLDFKHSNSVCTCFDNQSNLATIQLAVKLFEPTLTAHELFSHHVTRHIYQNVTHHAARCSACGRSAGSCATCIRRVRHYPERDVDFWLPWRAKPESSKIKSGIRAQGQCPEKTRSQYKTIKDVHLS